MKTPAELYEEYVFRLNKILSEDLLPEIEKTEYNIKVIHDPLWGSRLFYPWEIALIDTPLFQRLRRIYQLGTAYLTYPSAVHTRFSHSLGVTILAGRLITRLREKAEILGQNITITKRDIYTVRLAGILHDIGHTFFSHASEQVLGPILDPIKKHLNINNPKPHEFLSYLIIQTDYFKYYWEENISKLIKDPDDVPEIDDLSNVIIGNSVSGGKRFLTDIIYGPYDVDKLEYLFRDAKTAGLEISYDIERYFYKIRLVNDPKDSETWRLAIEEGGVRAIEQIIFSKMMLYSFVYHHQKVLTSDAMVGEIIMELLESEGEGQIKIEHPLDFLRYTDYDILSSSLKGPSQRFDTLRHKLATRDLPKRCFVMRKECILDWETDSVKRKNWDQLKNDFRQIPEDLKKIKEEIIEIINNENGGNKKNEITIDDIYIVFPKTPTMNEAASGPVINILGKLEPMDKYFDLEGWRVTYDLKKLRGYFFATDKVKLVVAKAIEKYIDKKYDLRFDESAKLEAKIIS